MSVYEKAMKATKWKSDRDIGHEDPAGLAAIRSKFENLKRMLEVHPELNDTAFLNFPRANGRIFLTRSSYKIHYLRDWGDAMMLLIETTFNTLDLNRIPIYNNIALITRDNNPWNLEHETREKMKMNNTSVLSRTEEGLLAVEAQEISIIDRMSTDLEAKQKMLAAALEVILGLEPGSLTSDEIQIRQENYEDDFADDFERSFNVPREAWGTTTVTYDTVSKGIALTPRKPFEGAAARALAKLRSKRMATNTNKLPNCRYCKQEFIITDDWVRLFHLHIVNYHRIDPVVSGDDRYCTLCHIRYDTLSQIENHEAEFHQMNTNRTNMQIDDAEIEPVVCEAHENAEDHGILPSPVVDLGAQREEIYVPSESSQSSVMELNPVNSRMEPTETSVVPAVIIPDLDTSGPEEVVETYDFEESEPSTSTGKGTKRPREDPISVKKLQTEKKTTVAELYGTREIVRAQDIVEAMARIKVYRGLDKKFTGGKRKDTDPSKLGKRKLIIRDPDLRVEVDEMVRDLMGNEVESLLKLKALQTKKEELAESLWIDLIKDTNSDLRSLIEHMRVLIRNCRVRTHLRMLGKARTTSTGTGNPNNLVVIQEKLTPVITLADTDDEPEPEQTEDVQEGPDVEEIIAETEVFETDRTVLRSNPGENLVDEVETTGSMFHRAQEQQHPLSEAQIADFERERFECCKCNSWYVTRDELGQHGLSKHNSQDVLKRGDLRDAEH